MVQLFANVIIKHKNWFQVCEEEEEEGGYEGDEDQPYEGEVQSILLLNVITG